MSTQKPHGGPVFPFEYVNRTHNIQESFATYGMIQPGAAEQYGGINMRAYFAAAAMQGLCANYEWMHNARDATGLTADEVVAKAAFEMADQMLAEGGYLDE